MNIGGLLDRLTAAGELYQKEADGSVRCFACGHRCLIREGKRGVCQVRFNEGGELRVPFGYVAALQSDPIEKKPFSHVLPGSSALTFGMLGCDFHCGYCFTGRTIVITNDGPLSLEECFSGCTSFAHRPHAEIGIPSDLSVISATGKWRRVKEVFKHSYHGQMINVRPYYLPTLQCTPDHRVFATTSAAEKPRLIQAKELTQEHYLAVPRKFAFSAPQLIHVDQFLSGHQFEYQTPWKLSNDDMQAIMLETERGKTSREIGLLFGKHPSCIRHIRSKFRRGQIQNSRVGGMVKEGNAVRFSKEHRPGIPAVVRLNKDVARLLGLYCAEGSVIEGRGRPNSADVVFSFSPREVNLADEVISLLRRYFDVRASLVKRETTLGVSAGKSSLGRLFMKLAGGRASRKCVPPQIFHAEKEIVQAFLNAVVDGDGHRFQNGKVSVTTVSRSLAYGIAFLVLNLGYLPSLYDTPMSPTTVIQGREVNREPNQYTIVRYEKKPVPRKMVETTDHYLIPVKAITVEEYDGFVYNMEVEGEHNYLAGFLAVSNCQNWFTSQAMRDPHSDESINLVRRVSPEQMVEIAQASGASVMVSSYNEPLITSEWAAAVFKEAKAAGLKCAYVSNGNNTPEVMEYLRPYLDAYKVDLKCMNDKNYRSLGGVLQNTLDGIKRAREMGLWVEVVTLVIPGFNDSNEELWDAARFLAGLSLDIPWHVTAFHKDYKMTDPENTDARTLQRAADIGREAGLRFVYAGNLPGEVGGYEDTVCPSCNETLVRRRGYVVREYRITAAGACPKCGVGVPGVWSENPARVNLKGTALRGL